MFKKNNRKFIFFLQINITQEFKMGITKQLPKLEHTLFDKAQSYILTLLESNSFKRFINLHFCC